MGVIVVYLATQIIPFITIVLYLSSDSFHNDFNKLYNHNKNFLKGVIWLTGILSITTGIISISSMIPELKVFLPNISSFHMIMAQFTMVIGALTLSVYSKYRSIEP